MFIFYVVLVTVIVGGWFVARRYFKINFNLIALAVTLALALVTPWITYSITASVAKNADQTYYEFWNGSEVEAVSKTITCTRDGSCRNEYDCDPYTVTHEESYTDSEGKSKTRTVTETKYHDCPYSAQETSYGVVTTLGNITVEDSLMTGEPFRARKSIPGGRVTSPPALWVAAQKRIASGNPSGVTTRNTYKNFILSSDETLFASYSGNIDKLVSENMLPIPADKVFNIYKANKAYSVGDTKLDMDSMNTQLDLLNAAFGSELRGDMHVVFADASKAGEGNDYTNSLRAFWNSEAVGKSAIAKNTLTLVVGVEPNADGKPSVAWSHGFTGMPIGNEALLQEFTNLKGQVIDDKFIGSPVFNIATETYTHSNGAVEDMVFGKFKFARVSMSATDEGDNGSGFKYLSDAWQMKSSDYAVVYWISGILCAMLLFGGGWAAMSFYSPRSSSSSSSQKRYSWSGL